MKAIKVVWKKLPPMIIFIVIGGLLVSCFFEKHFMEIGEERNFEFLERLRRVHGDNRYYFISSHKSLVKFGDSKSVKDTLGKYAENKISNSHICTQSSVLDESGSWTDERGDIYINFYCK